MYLFYFGLTIPPSFEDILEAQKNKGTEEYYAFEGLNYKKGFGDLIVWKQIIEFARTNKKKNIIFVTDDKKEDWMRIINSHGKKTISARPELVSEIFKEAGVENFYIYNSRSFSDQAEKYLKVSVKEQTIKDIENVNYEHILEVFENINKNGYKLPSFKDIYKEKFSDYELTIWNWLLLRYIELRMLTLNIEVQSLME